MRRWLSFLAIAATLCVPSAGQNQKSTFQVVGYFTEGGAKSGKYTVKDVVTSGAAARLTQINYAFGRIADNRCQVGDRETAMEHAYTAAESVDGTADPAGASQLRGTFHQLQELKRRYPKLKVVISFGGWGQSEGFVTAAQPKHRGGFVRSCVEMFILGRFAPGIEAPGIFDGIDLDWEYPVEGGVHQTGTPEDKKNLTALAAEFRRQMDAVRPGLLLTAAIPAPEELFKNFELRELSRTMDQLSIMAYDEHWSTEPVTNLHSSLFHDPADPSQPPLDRHYGDVAVQGFLKAGVPREKILFGVPFYGKGWSGVPQTNHGLYQPATGPTDPVAYRDLKMMSGADRKFYRTLGTCSVWDQGKFWGYDCPEAMQMKMQYIRRHGLGGVMYWEMSHDTDNSELLRLLAGR